MPLTFGSLFSGFGGMDLGLIRAGMQCKWQVEIDDYATSILERNFTNVPRWRDAREFPPIGFDIDVDIICGGDPCQANSAAGNSQQPSLGGEFVRIVDALRPRIVLRENPSHIRRDAPWPWWRFRGELESLGYAVLPFRLRACCLGAVHQRERLFLLAELADTNRTSMEGRDAEAAQERQPPKHFPALVGDEVWPTIPRRLGYASRNGLSGYVDRIRGLGNSVVPQVSEYIGRRIVEAATAEKGIE